MADNIFTKPIWEYFNGLTPGTRATPGVSGWGQQLVREARSAAPAAARVPAGNYQSRFSGMRDQAVRYAQNGIQWGEPASARVQHPATPAAGSARPPGGGDPNRTRVTLGAPREEVQSQALGTAIQQAQGPSFWESNTALKRAAESGVGYKDDGYLQRADIQAWMKANPKLAEQMLARRRAQGLSDGTAAAFDPATEAGMAVRDIQQREAAAAGMQFKDLSGLGSGASTSATFDPATEAGLALRDIQQREAAAAGMQFKDLSGLEAGRAYVNPGATRYQGQQPAIAAQQQATEPINFADALAVKSPLLERHLRLAGWGG